MRGHAMVGIRAAEVADLLVTVGPRARMIAAAAHESGMQGTRITELEDTQQAIDFLNQNLAVDDVVLVKGSRGMQMERIVTALEPVQ